MLRFNTIITISTLVCSLLPVAHSNDLAESSVSFTGESSDLLPEFMKVGRKWHNDVLNEINENHLDFFRGLMNDFNENIFHRDLQRDTDEAFITPAAVCEGYNNATGPNMTCLCDKYVDPANDIDNGVLVNCSYVFPRCSSDESYCFLGHFATNVIPVDGENTTVNTFMEHCTNVTTSPLMEYVCIRTFPIAPGDFRRIASCSAQYNFTNCASCTSCDNYEPDPNDNTTDPNATRYTVNCCNVETDKIQTCGALTDQGAAVFFADFFERADQGKCTSASSTMIMSTMSMIGTISAVAMAMLL